MPQTTPLQRGLFVLRALIILALLGTCLTVLGSRLLQEAKQHYPESPRWELVPSLRVLLTSPTTARGDHNAIKIIATQKVEVFCPDRPDRRHLLPAGTAVRFLPAGSDGIKIEIDSLDSQEIWPVLSICVAPHRRQRNSIGDDLPAGQGEARNGQAVFKLAYGGLHHSYRGNLIVTPADAQTLRAINVLPIEAYLEGMLQAEMAGNWPAEALKAQAIAGRSYAFAAQRQPPDGEPFDITDAGADPSYRGTGHGSLKVDAAVIETHGQLLTIQGDPFKAQFHASSGGHTASINDLEPGAHSVDEEHPLNEVMPAQADPWCKQGVELLGKSDSHWQRETEIRVDDLRMRLDERGIQGWPTYIETTRHPSGRVKQVTIRLRQRANQEGTQVPFTGQEFRELIGYGKLRSSLWVDEPRSSALGARTPQYQITTRGWGHGVGLSQVSSYAMARAGMDRFAILQFFYPRSAVAQRW